MISKKTISLVFISFLLSMFCLSAFSQAAQIDSKTISGLKFRSLGPALTSGRISDIAVNPENTAEYYVAAASGGIWKTLNSGTTWTPVFDHQRSYSIGCLAIDPNNTHILWAGTGENNSQRSVSYGDGIYKSIDGGKSWKNMGLKDSEHIGKILIDPDNSDIVYVAAQGPLWGPGGDRGLYKSIDGGKNWDCILYISNNTGVSDIAFDPRDPHVMYASSYQRRRHVWTLINGGPESAIYKTTDGGKNWIKLSNGLPGGDVGRIGLAVSPVNPDYVYAIIEAADDNGGFFRSTNRGASWNKQSNYVANSPQYYQEIVADPVLSDRVYSLDTYSRMTNDGGKSFTVLGLTSRHVDDHALWIDPKNNNHLIIGGDGGVYETWDLGKNWHYKSNLPITQFYRVSADNALPFYHIYGGTQDNNTIGGPSRTTSIHGILNSDWYITKGGDGFKTQIDPKNPNIVYSQSQYGWLVRINKETGESVGIKPMEKPGEKALRWNWDSPLIISPHNHKRLYFAANILFKSNDMGNSWEAISDDLTRQIDRDQLKVMDKIWSIDAVSKNASTSFYGSVVALCEAPLKEGLLYAGTDDGLINVTHNDGEEWSRIERFPDIPDKTYVSFLLASQHEEETVYACFDNHKNDDFSPYILKSTDAGKSWKSVTGNLPKDEVVYCIAEDHVQPNLLFAGTEFGVYVTIDGGKNWTRIKQGIPSIAIKDMVIQKRENDLVLASFGRGFYILDDYSPLRELSEDVLEKKAHIFPVKDALMFIETRELGRRGKSSQGDALFTAANPPVAAAITYFFNDSLPGLRELRKKNENTAEKQGKIIEIPSIDELIQEDLDEKPYLLFTIKDDEGNIIRRIKESTKKGIHRIYWNFRLSPATPASLTQQEPGRYSEGDQGFPVIPGKYSVSMALYHDAIITQMTDEIKFNCYPLNRDENFAISKELQDFYQELRETRRIISGTVKHLDELQNKVALMRVAVLNTNKPAGKMVEKLREIDLELIKQEKALKGDPSLSKRNIIQPPSITGRMGTIIYGSWRNASKPTQTQKDNYASMLKEFEKVYQSLKIISLETIPELEKKMEEMGSPWTPGRLPEWK